MLVATGATGLTVTIAYPHNLPLLAQTEISMPSAFATLAGALYVAVTWPDAFVVPAVGLTEPSAAAEAKPIVTGTPLMISPF